MQLIDLPDCCTSAFVQLPPEISNCDSSHEGEALDEVSVVSAPMLLQAALCMSRHAERIYRLKHPEHTVC